MRTASIPGDAPIPRKILNFYFAVIQQIIDTDTKRLTDFISGEVQA
jgi:hypothetical protein